MESFLLQPKNDRMPSSLIIHPSASLEGEQIVHAKTLKVPPKKPTQTSNWNE